MLRKRLTANLHLRKDIPPSDRPQEIVDELDDLAEDSEQLDVNVRQWPGAVRLDDPVSAGDPLIQTTVREFEQWATAAGVSIQPPFLVREITSSYTGESTTRVWLPGVCLAVHEEDTLLGVFPHTDDGEVYRVEDGIATLHQRLDAPDDDVDVHVDLSESDTDRHRGESNPRPRRPQRYPP